MMSPLRTHLLMLKNIASFFVGLSIVIAPAVSSADLLSDLQAQVQSLLAQIASLQAQQQGQGTVPPPTSDDYPVSAQAGACPNLTVTMQRGARDAATGGQVSELQLFLANRFDLNDDDVVTGYFGATTERYVQRFQQENGLPAYGIVGSLTRAAIARACSGRADGPTSDAQSRSTISDTSPLRTSITSHIVPQGSVVRGLPAFRLDQPVPVKGVAVRMPTNTQLSFEIEQLMNDGTWKPSAKYTYGTHASLWGQDAAPWSYENIRFLAANMMASEYADGKYRIRAYIQSCPTQGCEHNPDFPGYGPTPVLAYSQWSEMWLDVSGSSTTSTTATGSSAPTAFDTTPRPGASSISSLTSSPSYMSTSPTTLSWTSTNTTSCLLGFALNDEAGTKAVIASGLPSNGSQQATWTQLVGMQPALGYTTNVTFLLQCFGADGSNTLKGLTLNNRNPDGTAITGTGTVPGTSSGTASCSFNGQTVAHGTSVTAYQSSSVSAGSTCQSETRTCTNGSLSGTYTASTCSVQEASSSGPGSIALSGTPIGGGVTSQIGTNTRVKLADFTVTAGASEDVSMKTWKFTIRNVSSTGSVATTLTQLSATISGQEYPVAILSDGGLYTTYQVTLGGGHVFSKDSSANVMVHGNTGSAPAGGALDLWFYPNEMTFSGVTTGQTILPSSTVTYRGSHLYWSGYLYLPSVAPAYSQSSYYGDGGGANSARRAIWRRS